MAYSDIEIKLSDDVREKGDAEIIRRVKESVDACRDRDLKYRDFKVQLLGLNSANQGPWSGSSQVFDPITLRQCITTAAQFQASLRSEPYWDVEPVDYEDEENARDLESAITVKSRHWGLKAALYDVSMDVGRYPVAWTYAGWKKEEGDKRVRRYKLIKGENAGMVVDSVPEEASEAVDDQDRVLKYEGPDIQSLEPTDVYFYPPEAQHPDDAEQVIQRKLLTAEDLWRGIKGFGYEEKKIEDLVEKGEALTFTETDQDRLEEQGIRAVTSGYFECFQVIGRMPYIREDDKLIVPKALLNEDFCWLVCPRFEVCFRLTASPFDMRPYVPFYMLRQPRESQGWCVTSLAEVHQEEANTLLRLEHDLAELLVQPPLAGPARYQRKMDSMKLKPGKFFPMDSGDSPDLLKVMDWVRPDIGSILALRQDVRAQMTETFAAEGVENMRPPEQAGTDPTATQVNMVGGGVAAKRDLFLQTFQGSTRDGMERLAIVLVSHWLQHMGDDGETLKSGGKEISVTREVLGKRYRFIPSANSDASNPQIMFQMNMQKQQVQMTYWQILATQPPERWKLAYYLSRRLMEELKERNVTAILGPEPEANDPALVLQQVMQMLQQAAAEAPEVYQPLLMAIAPLVQGQGGGMDPNAMGGEQMPAEEQVPSMFDTASLNGNSAGGFQAMAAAGEY